MKHSRLPRLNSLLKEVISEVIFQEVKNPNVSQFVTVTDVDITADLKHAKVFISVIGTPEEKQKTLEALESAAGFIGVNAAKKVVMRHFPTLTFKLDESVDKHMRIEEILGEIHEEESSRNNGDETT
jgi:ribosome-binding factor A